MDPFEAPRRDHERAAALAERLTATGDEHGRAALFGELARQLELHARLEEATVYPEIERRVPALRDLVRRARDEHAALRPLLRDLRLLPGDSPEWDVRLDRVRDDVRRHVREEEGELFAGARAALGAAEAEELGAAVAAGRESLLEEEKSEPKDAAGTAKDAVGDAAR
jgi:hypothetical protein